MLNMLKNKKLVVSFIVICLGMGTSVYAEEMAEVAAEVNIAPESKKVRAAKDVVLTFQGELLDIMKEGATLGYQGRYKKMEGAIKESHNLAKVARIVIGKEWKGLSSEQRQILTDTFSRFSIASYAHNFKTFSGESFDYVSEDKTARGGIIVHSVFVLPKDKNVKFDYMLKKTENKWLIINVIANGVSDLALKRSEYTSILKRDGFDALIAKITERIDNYANQ
jgi:phospholipid transport system substrate-binding protein